MFSYFVDFIKELLKDWIHRTRIDIVAIAEDLAYKSGPHISPAIYKEFWLPYEKELIQFLKRYVDVICLWSSGNIEPLMPLFLEAGFNCFMPLERAAGMSALKLRGKYGHVILIGNIDKEALIKGKKYIEKEVNEKVQLIEEGGYIPTVDDIVPPEVSLSNYMYYLNLIKKFRY